MKSAPRDLAVVCSGGGARAAYQAGVLDGLARRLPQLRPRIYTGVSAGAINSVYLAAHPGSFPDATAGLVEMWRAVTPEQIFRTDLARIAGYFLRWGASDSRRRSRAGRRARALVDGEPLRRFLAQRLEGPDGAIPGLARNLGAGRLHAAAVITLSYAEGDTVVWVEGRDLVSWHRPGRRVVRTRLAISHLLASAALPVLFPAVRLPGGWYGDGGVRLAAPFSPAIHLGADAILGVSTRSVLEGTGAAARASTGVYPTPARIGGQILDAAFLELFDEDARRLEKVNQLCRALPDPAAHGVREIASAVVRPLRDLRKLAAAFEPELPRTLRIAVRRLGGPDAGGAQLLSLMLFVPGYVEALIDAGRVDAAVYADGVADRLDLDS